LAAAHQGLKAIVVEKAATLGGGTVDSYGIIWVGANHLAAGKAIKDNLADAREYVRFLAGGEASESRLATYVDKSPTALRFFERCGIPFHLVDVLPDHYFGLAPGAVRKGRSLEAALFTGSELGTWQNRIRLPEKQAYNLTVEEQISWGGLNNLSGATQSVLDERRANDIRGKGLGLISHFVKQLLNAGVTITTDVSTRDLLHKAGGVIGIVTSKGEKLRATRGVVLATGGYESNPSLVEGMERMPGWLSPTPPELRGEGLLLGSSIGGATQTIRNNLLLFLGIAVPEGNGKLRFHPAYLEELCSPHTMVVNRDGQRFGNETNFQMLGPKLRLFDSASHRYANLPSFLIFDQQYASNYSVAGGTIGGAVPKWIARSRTIRGLARRLGIDTAGLESSVERYNHHVRSGQDKDFHRGELAFRFSRQRNALTRNNSLGSIENPPFYGVPLCTSGYSSVGLTTNERAQVLDRRGKPIAGLYALGNTSAHDEFGTGYQAGFTHSSSMTFAYLAARHMSGSQKKHP
jgi:3-oxosteroid 1-dehydrogenase